jgi:hypothetical protein
MVSLSFLGGSLRKIVCQIITSAKNELKKKTSGFIQKVLNNRNPEAEKQNVKIQTAAVLFRKIQNQYFALIFSTNFQFSKILDDQGNTFWSF